MKILQVIPYFTVGKGGDVSLVSAISNELCRQGHEVTIISSDLGLKKNSIPSVPECQVILFNTSIKLGSFIYTPSMKKWLKKHLSEYDVVHAHAFRSYQNVILNSMIKNVSIPFIVQAHGSLPSNIGNSIMKKIFDILFLKKSISLINGAIALNQNEFNDYVALGVKSEYVNIISNATDIGLSFKSNPSDRVINLFDSKDDIRIVLFIGRLNIIKGPDIFVEAVNILLKKGLKIKSFLIGVDDGLRDSLENKISKFGIEYDVSIIGPLFDDDLRCAYSLSDLVVIPSRYDAFPMVLLEACSLGVPVVLSKLCAVQSEFTDYCYMSDPNPESIADAIFNVFADYHPAIMRSEAAKKYVINNYNIENVAKDLIGLYIKTKHQADDKKYAH